MSLFWQILISVGSGVGGVIVGGLLNHSLMIRQEHKLRIFNARIEAFSAFSNNVEKYVKRDYPEEPTKILVTDSGKSFFLSDENKAALKRIILVGSSGITDRCAANLITFLSNRPKVSEETIEQASTLLELLTRCMKYDLGHTKINLSQKPKGKVAISLEEQIKNSEEELFYIEKELSSNV